MQPVQRRRLFGGAAAADRRPLRQATEVQLLPGTTFSSVNDRGEYDSTGQAVMTMEELEKWLVWQIACVIVEDRCKKGH